MFSKIKARLGFTVNGTPQKAIQTQPKTPLKRVSNTPLNTQVQKNTSQTPVNPQNGHPLPQQGVFNGVSSNVFSGQNKSMALAVFYHTILTRVFQANGVEGAQVQHGARGARHMSLAIELANENDAKKLLSQQVLNAVHIGSRSEFVAARIVRGAILYQFQLDTPYWEWYTRADVRNGKASLGVGLGENRSPVEFQFVSPDHPHHLVVGKSGSGKTVTEEAILVASTDYYEPDDLKLVIIDPHNELERFDRSAHLIAPRAVSEADINNALHWTYNEFRRRQATNIKVDRSTHRLPGGIPQLILMIDEATNVGVFGDEETRKSLAQSQVMKGALPQDERLNMVRTLMKEARKNGIHVIVGMQEVKEGDTPGIIKQAADRWLGQLSSADESSRVSGIKDLRLHQVLTGKGDFMHVLGINATRFQVAMPTEDDFNRLDRCDLPDWDELLREQQSAQVIDSPSEPEDEPISPPIIEIAQTMPTLNPGGRPKNDLNNDDILAWYIAFGNHPDILRPGWAKERFGITGYHHNQYKERGVDLFKRIQTIQSSIGLPEMEIPL